MRAIGNTLSVLWMLVLGVIGLFAFFAVTAALGPGEVAWLTISVGVLALLVALHLAHVRHALSDGRHDELARSVHAMRERRGF